MSVHYTRITQEEFEEFLESLTPAYKIADVPGTNEIVYDLPLPADHLTIRLYSTLDRDGQARDIGADAIRTLLWNHETDSPEAGMTKTLRVTSWRDNLKPKIREIYDNWRSLSGDFRVQDLPDSTGAENEVRLLELIDSRYGRKAVLETPYSAKEDIKSLDWDETHRAWDAQKEAWTVDADSVEYVRNELAPEWELTKGQAPGVFDIRDVDFESGDRIRVTYIRKNSGKIGTKEGIARGESRANRLVFRRDDDHLMWIEDNELRTARSHAPYVGEVTEVEVLTPDNRVPA